VVAVGEAIDADGVGRRRVGGEYGMLVALIASVVVATFALGQVMTEVFVPTCLGVVTSNPAVATGSCTP
jgi:hypothetical protein